MVRKSKHKYFGFRWDGPTVAKLFDNAFQDKEIRQKFFKPEIKDINKTIRSYKLGSCPGDKLEIILPAIFGTRVVDSVAHQKRVERYQRLVEERGYIWDPPDKKLSGEALRALEEIYENMFDKEEENEQVY